MVRDDVPNAKKPDAGAWGLSIGLLEMTRAGGLAVAHKHNVRVNLFTWLISPSEKFAVGAELVCDGGLFIFTVIALAFVAAEYAAEHLDWPWGHARRKLFAVLVVIGFGGELIFEMGTFWYSYNLQSDQAKIIRDLGDEAGAAKSKAESVLATAKIASEKIGKDENVLGNLEKSESELRASIQNDELALSKERSARVAMLEQEKPRQLLPDQIKSIGNAVKGKYKTIYLAILCDQDAIGFSKTIMAAIEASGARPEYLFNGGAWCWDKFKVPASLNGITVYESSLDLFGAFAKVNVAAGGVPAPNPQFESERVPTPTIFVGQKSIPFQTFPEYALPPKFREWVRKHPPRWDSK